MCGPSVVVKIGRGPDVVLKETIVITRTDGIRNACQEAPVLHLQVLLLHLQALVPTLRVARLHHQVLLLILRVVQLHLQVLLPRLDLAAVLGAMGLNVAHCVVLMAVRGATTRLQIVLHATVPYF